MFNRLNAWNTAKFGLDHSPPLTKKNRKRKCEMNTKVKHFGALAFDADSHRLTTIFR